MSNTIAFYDIIVDKIDSIDEAVGYAGACRDLISDIAYRIIELTGNKEEAADYISDIGKMVNNLERALNDKARELYDEAEEDAEYETNPHASRMTPDEFLNTPRKI